jgi:hypothetical protein
MVSKRNLLLSILIKGNECEDMCLSFVMEQVDKGFLFKNEEQYSNDWLTGTPDVVTDQVLIDVKNSWSGVLFHGLKLSALTKSIFFSSKAICFYVISRKHYSATA